MGWLLQSICGFLGSLACVLCSTLLHMCTCHFSCMYFCPTMPSAYGTVGGPFWPVLEPPALDCQLDKPLCSSRCLSKQLRCLCPTLECLGPSCDSRFLCLQTLHSSGSEFLPPPCGTSGAPGSCMKWFCRYLGNESVNERSLAVFLFLTIFHKLFFFPLKYLIMGVFL